MSVKKFEITEDHLKLVKHIQFEVLDGIIRMKEFNRSPFGGDDLIQDMGSIIYGKPKEEFDPNSYEEVLYNNEERGYLEELFSDLPTVIEIALNLNNLTAGEYKTKYHYTNWKQV